MSWKGSGFFFRYGIGALLLLAGLAEDLLQGPPVILRFAEILPGLEEQEALGLELFAVVLEGFLQLGDGGIALDDLRKMITEVAELPEVGDNDVTVTNMRHYEALKNALASIRRVNDGLASNISGDFLSQDLRECLQHIGEITGEITTDEVLGNIFKNFCIGK
jgi:hypothetical protein